MAYYDPRLGILRRPPPLGQRGQPLQQQQGIVPNLITPPASMMGPMRAQMGQQGQAVRWTPADMGGAMEMPLGPMGPHGPRQQAEAAPINVLDMMGQQGQAPVGIPGPLGALQDSFAAASPAMQQVDRGNPLGPPVAPMGPVGPIQQIDRGNPAGPPVGPIGAMGGNILNLFNRQMPSAYPPRRRRLPRF